MERLVRDWYVKTYPKDELGEQINSSLTFLDVEEAIQEGTDVYLTIGVHDSIIRERIFEEIAMTLKVAYSFIYDMWLSYCKKDY